MAKEGEFLRINYTAKTKDDGKVFDTTSEAEAKKAGIFNERVRYGPALVPVGKKQVIEGLDEELLNAKKGDKKQIVIPAAKGFGTRNADDVRLVPLSKFQEQKVQPYAGMPVELDGRAARVQSVSGGRVRVDFNHPLADKELVYDYEVVAEYSKPEEKFAALASDLLPDCKASYNEGVGTLEVPLKVDKSSRDYLVMKTRFYVQAFAFIPETKKLEFREEWGNPQEELEHKRL
ncbi:peptidylprolyl isomerase [Candidatus Micrarchaeota archaeon CG10_big_fil_rev_8_21_14_0_10_60_32]|nr:MAG: hypothetical protein AUJ16_03775 [Candidatus Micrarchaeota archaeon CG1_02_60_51]PIN96030.1 MAG: peptidylprolyl isomerase [Candidatus Micrarchaeota archaeon CG10_big_fil_rev_8_21_14_0_10_60_32]PIY91991.1 MAG: peptidylprolyl isomerase [Candidatus Micrarchaeota archaeon CG_4_10_14_0_8_um_filter_60_7]